MRTLLASMATMGIALPCLMLIVYGIVAVVSEDTRAGFVEGAITMLNFVAWTAFVWGVLVSFIGGMVGSIGSKICGRNVLNLAGRASAQALALQLIAFAFAVIGQTLLFAVFSDVMFAGGAAWLFGLSAILQLTPLVSLVLLGALAGVTVAAARRANW